jgi:hypothetical protein
MFLKVCIESKHLPIVLKPRRLDSWDIVIACSFPLSGAQGQIELGFSHGVE